MSTRPVPRWSRALVTGASSGIGREIAVQLAGAGTALVLVARDGERLNVLANSLREDAGVGVEVLAADLSAPVARTAVERRLASSESPVDLLVNNAGFGTSGPFAELPVGREEQQVQLNVVAVQRLTSAVLPGMLERGRGSILNVASIAAFLPSAESATYGATKAFVRSFSDALHDELAGTGVTVTASMPGFTRTEFQERSGWEEQSNVPSFAWLSAEQVARDSLAGAAAGRARVVPGVGYKALVGAAQVVPDGPRRWLTARVRRLAR
ncbi:MAG: SDR family NAD(P)-dependent oxidoreductase [Microthrixaceae bacterium]